MQIFHLVILQVMKKDFTRHLVNGSRGIVVGSRGEEFMEEGTRQRIGRGAKDNYLGTEGKENLENSMVSGLSFFF